MKTKFTKVQLKEWIDALRSGKYKQGTTFLNKDDKFCCLGVLCDLHKDGLNIGIDSNVITYNGRRALLPMALCLKFGISHGGHHNNNYPDNLAYANDNGKSFAEIADIIEANFETID